MLQITYVKNGRTHTHPTLHADLQSALACAHELTRDGVADFTRIGKARANARTVR